jgi:molecular chaperone DnaK
MSTSDSAISGPQPPIGIDLGTTFSVLAYIDSGGRPVTAPNGQGDLLTASAVYFDDNDVIVGREARKSSVINPDVFAECFKRDMGAPACRRKIRGFDVPPEVLSAFVLARMKQDAEPRLGPIQKVVVTVPAFFDETRRRATQEAGRLAGLDVMDIINEPTAAAVAFGYQHGFLNLRTGGAEKPLRVLVYDLGGGTFDVTVLEISGTEFRALATDGDVQLGGRDFDERLVSHLAEQFQAAHGVDPRSDPQDAAQLWLDAIEAKHSLTERAKTNVVCFHAGIRFRQEVTRQQFEEMTCDLVERSETTASLVVNQSGLTWDQIDRVLLVGGATRMPMVVEMLRRTTGKEPDRSMSPDEVVAHGAALYAEMLMGRKTDAAKTKCKLVNVNSHSLGVIGFDKSLRQKVNAILIPKNTPLPARASRTFVTARAGQKEVLVPVVEGESHQPEDCIKLGKCVVQNLPPDLPAGTPIEVEYRYGGNGCVSVSARVPSVRQSASVQIERQLTRDLEDLATWKARLCGMVPPSSAGFAEAGEAVDPADRSSVVKRLDTLCMKVGRAAVQLKVPDGVEQSRHSAVMAAAELMRMEKTLTEAEKQRQGAISTSDIIRCDAALSQARAAVHQTKVKSDFAHLILGRESVRVGFCPPRHECDRDEIRQWQKHLEQLS